METIACAPLKTIRKIDKHFIQKTYKHNDRDDTELLIPKPQ